MDIHLHLGAHKTATTYIQAQLQANLETLNENGVGYMNLSDFRRRFTQHLMHLPPSSFSDPANINSFFWIKGSDRAQSIIVSDENLLGSPMELVNSGNLYPDVVPRMAKIRQLFQSHRVTLYFSIRSYAGFLSSNYCEALRHSQNFTRFVDFRTRLDEGRMRWPFIVTQIIENLKPDATFIWRYEDFRNNSDALLRAMSFDLDLRKRDMKDQRPSFSQTAIDILSLIADRHGSRTAASFVRTIGEGLPKNTEMGEFSPWSLDQKRKLDDLYAHDCRAMPVRLHSFTS